jgi:hypothetical protein
MLPWQQRPTIDIDLGGNHDDPGRAFWKHMFAF